MLYASLGDRGKRDTAQNINDDSGSIIEIDLNNSNSYKIYSLGHRNPQGLTINPFNNQIWSHEHGPRGGDEINIIKKDKMINKSLTISSTKNSIRASLLI